jgi:hypothetical protein
LPRLVFWLCLAVAAAPVSAQQQAVRPGGGVPILGVTQSKQADVFPLSEQQQVGTLAEHPFSLAPLVQDAGAAYYMSDAGGPTLHTFDGTNESGGANLFGTAGGFFLVLEGVVDLGGGVERVIVEVRAVDGGVVPEPWVDASNAGTGLIDWRLDIGSTAGGSDPIEPGVPFTVVDSGVAAFDSALAHLGTFDLAADTSTATGLSGVAILGIGGADIAGTDLAALQIYWDVQYEGGAVDLALQLVDAEDGAYAPGSLLTTFVLIENLGGSVSPESGLALYASSDTDITDSDPLLGNFVVPPLAPGGLLGANAIASLPGDLPNGEYYIGGILSLADEDAANNIGHDPVPILVSTDPAIRVRPQSLSFTQPEERGFTDDHQQDDAVLRREATQRALVSLLDAAASKGEVRVIVGFDAPFQPEGQISAADRQSQRQAIQSRGDQLLAGLRGKSYRENRRYRFVPYMALTVGTDVLQYLSNSPLVTSIEEDRLARPTLATSNNVIGSPLAWAEGDDGSGQAVAILDTGVDKAHPFFTAGGDTVVSEACYSTNSADSVSLCPGGVPSSTAAGSGVNCDASVNGCDHGTHVAGIVAGNDGVGPNFGVAQGADLIAMQVFSRFDDEAICGIGAAPCALSWSSDQISALERIYELREALDIAAANMSLGGGRYFDQASCDADNPSVKAAIDNLRSVGIATVIASGNDGFVDSIGSPGCISSAVSVGATTDSDSIAGFSNIYPQIHLLAPGVDITSSVPAAGIASFNGTSMATPHVAGAWAVLKQLAPSASVDTVLASLQSTATPVDDLRIGGIETAMPRINLDLAIGEPRTTFGVFNDGPGSLSVNSIVPESPAPWIGVVPAGPFEVPAGPFEVPAGGLQVVEVTIDYDLAPAGDSQVRLLISSNDPTNDPWPDGVYVNVSTPLPMGPEFESDPPGGSTLDFGDQEIDVESSAMTIQVTNPGDENLTLSCEITGADAAHFHLAACPTPVVPAATTDLSATCEPTSVGEKSATLVVTTNDADEGEVNYSLSCTGVLPPVDDVIFEDGFEDL